MGRPHIAADRVAGLQIKLADLRWGNINVVRAGQIVLVGRAEKTIAVGQDFEDTLGKDVAFFFALCLEDLEDEVLFPKSTGSGYFEAARDTAQLSNIFFF
jgi:hypothetical protein